MTSNLYKKISNFFSLNENIIFKIVMSIFIAITLSGLFFHEPWRDESQAWLIAQDLNIWQIINHMKYEGHLLAWYLLLMPFAKTSILPYPYPMLLIHIFLSWAVVYLLWKKSQFHPLLKILITFSVPIAYQYAIVARCYAISILLLFLLATFFSERLKRPYLYATLLAIGLNTSVMALPGIGAFFLIFFYDLIKNTKTFYKSKKFLIPATTCLLGIITMSACILTRTEISQYTFMNGEFWKTFGQCFHLTGLSYPLIALIAYAFFILTLAMLRKNKKVALFFSISIILTIAIFKYIYIGSYWHYYFYFIYLIVTLWLFEKEKIPKTKFQSAIYAFLILLILNSTIHTIPNYIYDIKNNYSNAKEVADFIIETPKLKEAAFITCDTLSSGVIPYLRDHNIKMYSCFDGEKSTYFKQNKDYPLKFKIKLFGRYKFQELLNSHKNLYLIFLNETIMAFKAEDLSKTKEFSKYNIKWIPVYESKMSDIENGKMYIFKIEKINKGK